MTDPTSDAKWAFETLKLSPSSSLEDVNNIVKKLPTDQSAEATRMRYASEIVLSILRFRTYEKDSSYNTMFMNALVTGDHTSFQNLLMFCLRRLREHKYRREGDHCFEEINSTRAWKSVCSVREFVIRETRKEIQPEQFKNLTNPKDNLDTVVKHLSEVEHSEFPSLKVDPMLIAFTNGWYNISENVFWDGNSKENWEELRAEVESERRQAGWGDSYCLTLPDVDRISACSFVNRKFRPWSNTGVTKMSHVNRLFAESGIDSALHGWLHILMGRMFFPLGMLDRWQIMPFLKTQEGFEVGLSTMVIDIYKTITGSEGVSTSASGHNLQHAMDGLNQSRIGVLLFRENGPPLEQGDWQSAISNEEVLITPAGRLKTAFAKKWDIPLFGVGSHVSFKNDAGTVCRRIVMFDVSKMTSELLAEIRLFFEENIDYWLQMSVAAYLTAVNEHADHDIWAENVMPPEALAMRESLREMTNPLHTCLSSGIFTFDKTLHMQLSDFKDLYYEFRRKKRLPNQRWVRDHWNNAFEEFNLTVERSQREYHGIKSTTEWIIGIDTSERSQAIAITPESVQVLITEQSKLNGDLERITKQIEISKKLLEAETSILEWRKMRTDLREDLLKLIRDRDGM